MVKKVFIERLNDAVDAILSGDTSSAFPMDSRMEELVQTAQMLAELPRQEFREQLRAELQTAASSLIAEGGKKSTMSDSPGKQTIHSIIPYLAVQEAEGLIDFVKEAFGSEEILRSTGTQGGLHAEVRIGDSKVMIGGGVQWKGPSRPTALHLYVPDVDDVYRRAMDAGASSLCEPMDQPYGDREGSVKDLAGNFWYIGTHKGESHIPKGLSTVTPFLHPKGTETLLEFVEQAFGAEEIIRVKTPAGVIVHAKTRIGESVIEMGEAHGMFQPMPTTFYMYVDDVDSLYERALKAGGKSLQQPAGQPYGDRVAAVEDPAGNSWYLAAPNR